MALIGQAVSEKKIFENGGRRTDDGRGRTPDHGHPISSPCEPAKNRLQNTKQLEPQQKYRLGTISNIKLLGGLNLFYRRHVVHNI